MVTSMPQGHLIHLIKSHHFQASAFLFALIIHLLLFSQFNSWLSQTRSSTPDDTILIDFSETSVIPPETINPTPQKKKEVPPPQTAPKPLTPKDNTLKQTIPKSLTPKDNTPREVPPEKKETPPKEVPPPPLKEVKPIKEDEVLLNRLIPEDEKKKLSIKNLKAAEAAPRLIPEPAPKQSVKPIQKPQKEKILSPPQQRRSNTVKAKELSLQQKPEIQNQAKPLEQPTETKNDLPSTAQQSEIKEPLQQQEENTNQTIRQKVSPNDLPSTAQQSEIKEPLQQQEENTNQTIRQKVSPNDLPSTAQQSEIKEPLQQQEENTNQTIRQKVSPNDLPSTAQQAEIKEPLQQQEEKTNQTNELPQIADEPTTEGKGQQQNLLAPLAENYLFSEQPANSTPKISIQPPQDGIQNGAWETNNRNFYQLNNYNWQYESYMGYWAKILIAHWENSPPTDYISGQVPQGGTVQVSVTLDQHGDLISYEVLNYDVSTLMVNSVLDAVIGAADLSDLPEDFEEKYLIVTFNFVYPSIFDF